MTNAAHNTKTVSSQGAGIQGPYRAPVFYVDDAQNIVDGWFVSRRGAIVRVALCGRPGVTRTVHARYVFTRWAPT